MKSEALENYITLWNNKALDPVELPQQEIAIQPSVYEVIRITEGVPLFLEEHIERLKASVNLLNFRLDMSFVELKAQVNKIISINKAPELNLKIVVNNLNTANPNVFMFFISSKYPTPEDYSKGVNTSTYRAERHNPNAKVVALSLREKMNRYIKEQKVYEAILVNTRDEITEGSRSNIFMVKDSIIYTPPAGDVLMGITRSRIIEICRDLNINVVEEPIAVSKLREAEGLFLTGTSPKVLPIAAVDDIKLSSAENNVIGRILEAYNHIMSQYIAEYK